MTRVLRAIPTGRRLAALAVMIGLSTAVAARQTPAARTTRDGVYTKEQATAGKALFDKYCASCHAFKPWEKSDTNPDLGGEPFMANWNGKTVRELLVLIRTTMPNDGSAELTETQTAEVVAYMLQENGYQPGTAALPIGEPAGAITIVK
jgi:mono/diheme cytochrome c family protein